jgi:hypothetical protein
LCVEGGRTYLGRSAVCHGIVIAGEAIHPERAAEVTRERITPEERCNSSSVRAVNSGINFPSAIAHAMEFTRGEIVEVPRKPSRRADAQQWQNWRLASLSRFHHQPPWSRTPHASTIGHRSERGRGLSFAACLCRRLFLPTERCCADGTWCKATAFSRLVGIRRLSTHDPNTMIDERRVHAG